MDCRTAAMLISLQPDAQLTTEERAGLAAHIAVCRTCAREQQLQERLSRTLQEMGRVETVPPVELGSLVVSRLRSERRSPLTYIPAAWRKGVAAAAAFLLIAGSSAGVTAGIWKMANGGKNVVLETTPPIVIDGGNGYLAPAGSGGTPAAGLSTPDNTGTPQDESSLGENPDAQNAEGGHEGTVPPATATTLSEQRTLGEETVLLSEGVKVTSTVLRFAVEDMTSSRAKAVSIAAGTGASNQVFPIQDNGKSVLVMRLAIDSQKASGLITSLSGIGTLVDRQDESRDLTSIYNETMVEYRDLLARAGTVQDPEEKRKMEMQADSYKQQLDAWSEESGKRVVMVWLESQ